MLTKDQKASIRNIIFRHLDGVSIATTLVALNKNKIIPYILKNKNFDTITISKNFNLNLGYFNIALRLLASQGLLNQKITIDGENISYSTTSKGLYVFEHIDKYLFCLEWFDFCLDININKSKNDTIAIAKDLLLKSQDNWGLNKNHDINSNDYYISKHLNGILISPIISSLGFNGILKNNKSFKNFINKSNFNIVLGEILMIENWLTKDYEFTDEGNYAFMISSAYGVTSSYLNTFIQVDNLIFNNPKVLKINSDLKTEIHVNRSMNVWGSGGAHKTYFKCIDKIIRKLFNLPLEAQPIGIADMGCGNGEFLIHIYDLIEDTLRGKNISTYPLHLIGADFNDNALIASKQNLNSKNIEHILIKADISNPREYAEELKKNFNIDLRECLNIRSFLDHNRIFHMPTNKDKFKSTSTCSFSSKGEWIPNYILENNLVEHFINWKPYISKFGLILLELHSLDPMIVKNNLGKSLSTAYDATHGYSDQYILELNEFKNCINKAGLRTNGVNSYKFPNNNLGTISINYIK